MSHNQDWFERTVEGLVRAVDEDRVEEGVKSSKEHFKERLRETRPALLEGLRGLGVEPGPSFTEAVLETDVDLAAERWVRNTIRGTQSKVKKGGWKREWLKRLGGR